MQKELFDITINTEGRSEILRLFSRMKIIFIAALVLTILSLTEVYIRMNWLSKRFQGSSFNGPTITAFAYTFVIIILFILQAWHYYRFSKLANDSLNEQDQVKFNQSFRSLNTNAAIGLVSLTISIAFTFFNIFTYTRLLT